MAKLKVPLLSFVAHGGLGSVLSFRRQKGSTIAEKKPVPSDAQSSAQLSWRHMFNKCVDLWHELSVAEKAEWESAASCRHMTGYAWYISQCLRPNPGIYLPLQGGTMSGDIDMDGHGILDLPDPTNPQDAATKAYASAPGTTQTKGARVYHNVNQAIAHNTWTALAFNSERYNTDAIHNPAANNSRLTCKTAGKYLIVGQAQFAKHATGVRYFKIREGGDTDIVFQTWDAQVGARTVGNLATIYNLAVDEYVELLVFQLSGAALNIMSGAQHTPEFMMQRIG